MIDDRTARYDWPLPNPANNARSVDIPRMIAALEAIDQRMWDAFEAIGGKAAAVHTHAIASVSGLQSALDGKSGTGHQHALDDLTDVSTAGAADNQVMKRVGGAWQPGAVQTAEVGGLTAALAGKAATDDARLSDARTPTAGSVTNASFANRSALAVIGRSANSVGAPADINATVSGHVLRRAANALDFGLIGNDSFTDMPAATFKGRAAGALSGPPTDLSAEAAAETLGLSRPFATFLPANFNRATDDAREHFETAAAWSESSGVTVDVPRKVYQIKSAWRISNPGCRFNWSGTRLRFTDSAALSQTVQIGLVGRVGILVDAVDCVWTGDLSLEGASFASNNTVTLLMFKSAHRAAVSADIRVSGAAGGVWNWLCDNALFTGDVVAVDMLGEQTFSGGSMGDGQVISGCRWGMFGRYFGRNVDKANRYLSPATQYGVGAIDNVALVIGDTHAIGPNTPNTQSSALSLRSALDCQLGRVYGRGINRVLNIQIYNSDAAWKLTGVRIGWVTAEDCNATSGNAVTVSGDTSVIVGRVTIEGVTASNGAGHAVNANRYELLTIGEMQVHGCRGGFVLQNGRNNIGDVYLSGITGDSSYYGDGFSGWIRSVRMLTGAGVTLAAVVRKLGSTPNSLIRIGTIEHPVSGIGTQAEFLLYDTVNTCASVRVDNTIGLGSIGGLSWQNAEWLTANGGVYVLRQVNIAAKTGVGAGTVMKPDGTNPFTVTVLGVKAGVLSPTYAAGTSVEARCKAGSIAPFSISATVYADNVITIEPLNCASVSADWPTRNYALYINLGAP